MASEVGRPTVSPAKGVDLLREATYGKGKRIQLYRLRNGLSALLLEDHASPVIAYQTWLRVGARHERAGRTGMAHLFEHLMFKETRNLKEGEFDRIVEDNGGYTNAATWLDWTYYQDSVPASRLDLIVKLEADRLENMVLNQAQLDSEREVVLNERDLRVENDPDGRMQEALFSLAFKQHPYGRPVIGWKEDIKAITLDDCLAFHRHFYCPANATIVIVGDFETAAALELLNSRYGGIASAQGPDAAAPPEPAQTGERRLGIPVQAECGRLLVAYRTPEANHPDIPVLEVLNEALFGSEASRIHRCLVTETEVAVSTSGWVSGLADPGIYEISGQAKEGRTVEEMLGVFDSEVTRLLRDGIEPGEVERAKTKLETDFVRGLLSVGSRARGLGSFETTTGDFRRLLDLAPAYAAVTSDDAMRVASEILCPDRRSVVIGEPVEGE